MSGDFCQALERLPSMEQNSGSDSLAVQQVARELQLFAGRVGTTEAAEVRSLLQSAVRAISTDVGPLAFWIIRNLFGTAIREAQAHLGLPGCDLQATHRLSHSPDMRTLVAALPPAIDSLADPDHRCQLPGRDRRIDRAVAFIREQCGKPTLTLDRTADEVGLSKWHLSRLILRNTGMAYRELVMSIRLEVATTLLAEGTSTMKEISARLGYASSTEFHRLFKQRFGVTPTQWRLMHQRASR
jgi:AraC-type DNA-binding domain-containing proteins